MTPEVELIPVLELEPGAWKTQERECPTSGGSADFPDEWYQYWVECLADSGLKGIEPIRKGSWLVPLDSLTDDSLQSIIEKELEEDSDEPSAMCGGYVLSVGERFIDPQCCCDLGDIYEWVAASEHQGAEWAQVWIGHPWTHVRATDERLEFAELSEEGVPEDDEPLVTVQRSSLEAKVASAKSAQLAFAARIEALLARDRDPEFAKTLAEAQSGITQLRSIEKAVNENE